VAGFGALCKIAVYVKSTCIAFFKRIGAF